MEKSLSSSGSSRIISTGLVTTITSSLQTSGLMKQSPPTSTCQQVALPHDKTSGGWPERCLCGGFSGCLGRETQDVVSLPTTSREKRKWSGESFQNLGWLRGETANRIFWKVLCDLHQARLVFLVIQRWGHHPRQRVPGPKVQ